MLKTCKHFSENYFTLTFDGAKQFIEENKDQFGEYLEQAKGLLSGSEGVNGLLDKVKGLF
ncbi:hypothetical protein [Streptococcus suis]|uniref:hypothetical protein n=1 Tax=Streptococcus suis TaxID=1307 RepID=UPI0038B77876